LALSTTPFAGSLARERSTAWPPLIEASLVVAAIGVLLPFFTTLAEQDTGRDRRFAEPLLAVGGLPEPVLPELCAAYGAMAEPVVRERLCGRGAGGAASDSIDRLPLPVVRADARARQAFLSPLRDARARLDDLRQRQRQGLGDLLALGDAIESAETELQPFVERYRLDYPGVEGPLPLACAYERVEAALTRPLTLNPDVTKANAVMLLAGALDGHPATPSLASLAALPGGRSGLPACVGFGGADSLAAAAILMGDARTLPMTAAKNEAMRALLKSAGWQWAAWAVLGLALLKLSRRAGSAAIGIALALAIWAAAAWAGRVPWPIGRAFVPGRDSSALLAVPADFVLWLLGAALVVLALSPWLRRALASRPQQPASSIGYPGLVLATGIGWLLLLDLSANGNPSNRYLALYHQGHLWLAMLSFSLVVFLRQPLGRMLAWTLSVVDGIANSVGRRLGAAGGALVLIATTLLLIAAIGALLLNVRQLTSEIGRLWLIVGAAWFFFLRGTPLTERLARSGTSLISLGRYVWPLLFVVTVLIGAMLVTKDMGPLLIAGYGAGAFVAASVAMWWYQRRGTMAPAYALAVILFAGWIVGITYALFKLGSVDDVAAGRLESVAAPLASANDQLALVTWFQRAAPETGFGPGAVPWCGFGAHGTCAGVPAQIQSDYTFTALVGTFGWSATWLLTLGCAVWLHWLVAQHGRATRGEPRFVRSAGRMSNDDQAFLSWICVTWVVLALCQLAVTVAGNLAVIPLTGVTFPFVSFGMTSLVMNTAMLALAVNVSPDARGDG